MPDALIHLRVPAALKGRWVRASMAAGKTLRVSVYDGVEQVKPWGSYSMTPIVRADRVEEVELAAPNANRYRQHCS